MEGVVGAVFVGVAAAVAVFAGVAAAAGLVGVAAAVGDRSEAAAGAAAASGETPFTGAKLPNQTWKTPRLNDSGGSRRQAIRRRWSSVPRVSRGSMIASIHRRAAAW